MQNIILFDLRNIEKSKRTSKYFHGGGEYTKSVFLYLLKNLDCESALYGLVNFTDRIDPAILDICRKSHVSIVEMAKGSKINEILKKGNFTVFYSATPNNCNIKNNLSEVKYIYSVFDLLQFQKIFDSFFPQFEPNPFLRIIKYLFVFSPMKWLYAIVKETKKKKLYHILKQAKIVAISDYTKFSIMNIFPPFEEKQLVTLFAPRKVLDSNNLTEELEQITLKKYNVNSKKYILLVNCDRWYKNAIRAVVAIDNVLKSHEMDEVTCLLLGVTNDHLKQKIDKITNNNPKISMSSYVSLCDLEVLYKNARLFLYPTLGEGFGYPPLEAMKYGTVCACSAVTSVMEVCGDCVTYFNPYDIVGIKQAILNAIDDDFQIKNKNRIIERYYCVSEKQDNDLKILNDIILGYI